MTAFTPLGYMTLKDAVDFIGQHLMPLEWLGHEVDLLRGGVESAMEKGVPSDQVERLGRAVSYLVGTLTAGTLQAFAADEEGRVHEIPRGFWADPEMPSAFRSGELPQSVRIALEGHKAHAGSRIVLIPEPQLHHFANKVAPSSAAVDAGTGLRPWLEEKIRLYAGKPHPTKKHLWQEAQTVFGDALTYRSFSHVWRATVPPDWRMEARARASK